MQVSALLHEGDGRIHRIHPLEVETAARRADAGIEIRVPERELQAYRMLLSRLVVRSCGVTVMTPMAP